MAFYLIKGAFIHYFFIKERIDKNAFTVCAYNKSQTTRRYLWTFLSPGMLNSPTLCQYFVGQPLEMTYTQLPKSIIYHYMDNILLPQMQIL